MGNLFPKNREIERLEKMKNRARKRPVSKFNPVSYRLVKSRLERFLRLPEISGNSVMGDVPIQSRSYEKEVFRFGSKRQHSQRRIVLKYLYWSWGVFHRG